MAPTLNRRVVEIFFSYAHEDESLQHELEKHLRHLQFDGVIKAWSDKQIQAGHNWEREIDRQLLRADIILLMVSPDFLASEFCYQKEMPLALKRHETEGTSVIPIILRESSWEGTALGSLQALPTGGKPVTDWADQDKALKDVAQGIRSVVDDIASSKGKRKPPTLYKTYKKLAFAGLLLMVLGIAGYAVLHLGERFLNRQAVGEVVDVDTVNQIIQLDIGSVDGVKDGDTLEVFDLTDGGYAHAGSIILKEVKAEYSNAKLLPGTKPSSWPFKKGWKVEKRR